MHYRGSNPRIIAASHGDSHPSPHRLYHRSCRARAPCPRGQEEEQKYYDGDDYEQLMYSAEFLTAVKAALALPAPSQRRAGHVPGEEPAAVEALQSLEAWGMPVRHGASLLAFQGRTYTRYIEGTVGWVSEVLDGSMVDAIAALGHNIKYAIPSISPLATWHPHLARPPRSHSLVPRGRYPRIYVAEETLARQRSFRQEPSTASTHEPSARPPSVPPTALDEPARLIMYLPPQGGANETGNPGNWYSKPPLSTFYCPSYCPWCHMACPPHPIALCATWQVRARRAARPAHAPGVRARCARPAAAAAAGLQQRCALRPGRARAEPIPPTAAMGPRAASQRRHHVQGRRRQWQAHHPLSTSLDATWHALLTLPPLTPRGR